MSEKATFIVTGTANPAEKEALGEYLEKSRPLFEKAGGAIIGKYKVAEHYIGSRSSHMIAVMDFPNSQAIKDLFESEEYKKLLPIRDKAFTELDVYICQS